MNVNVINQQTNTCSVDHHTPWPNTKEHTHLYQHPNALLDTRQSERSTSAHSCQGLRKDAQVGKSEAQQRAPQNHGCHKIPLSALDEHNIKSYQVREHTAAANSHEIATVRAQAIASYYKFCQTGNSKTPKRRTPPVDLPGTLLSLPRTPAPPNARQGPY